MVRKSYEIGRDAPLGPIEEKVEKMPIKMASGKSTHTSFSNAISNHFHGHLQKKGSSSTFGVHSCETFGVCTTL